jgi:hypothetical protein
MPATSGVAINSVGKASCLTSQHKVVDDVPRRVAEVVAEVLVGASTVDVDAAVGTDAAPEKRPWRSLEKLRLPGLKEDAPSMLRSRTVLRERADEVRTVDGDLHALSFRGWDDVHGVRWEATLQEIPCLADDHWVLAVERDSQPVCAGSPGDAAVA